MTMKTRSDPPNWISKELDAAQHDIAVLTRYAFAVLYVEVALRAERDTCSFEDAMQAELDDRGLWEFTVGVLMFERERRGHE